MGDMLFDDFDVDALLDAQSSDDDGSDLPDLERSLDDILNDTEFSDILGHSASVKSFDKTPKTEHSKSSDLIANGLASIGLEGETIENSRSRLDYRNGEKFSKAEKITFFADAEDAWIDEPFADVDQTIVNSVEGNSQKSTTIAEVLHLSPSLGTGTSSRSDNLSHVSKGGAEIFGVKRIVAVSSNYGGRESSERTLGALGLINGLPQFSKTKASPRPGPPNPRPGAAFAAAAAASRQSGPSHSSAASRFSKSTYSTPKGPSIGTVEDDNNHLEVDGSFSSEDPPTQARFLDESSANNESFSTALASEVDDETVQDSAGRVANVGVLGLPNEWHNSSGNISAGWNNDEVYAAATADLNEEVEILSTLVSQLHEQSSYAGSSNSTEAFPKGVESGSRAEPAFPNATDDDSCENSSDTSIRVRANEIEEDWEVKSQIIRDEFSEPAAQADQPEPELSDVVSLNNWIEEPQEHSITSTELASSSQLHRAESKNSIHANAAEQAMDEMEQQQHEVGVDKETDLALVDEKPKPTALQIAEELERNAASSGLHWEEGAVAQPMRLEGIQRSAPAIGLLQVDAGGQLSYALQSSALRREHGLPQSLAVHSNFIAIGLSKGAILVIPSKYSATRSADETDAKPFVLATPGPDKSVTSMCFNQQGDLLLVGYSNGHLLLWDVPKANVVKTLEKEHSVAIVHTLFLGQDVLGTRNFKTITSDSKGLTLLHTFTVLPVPVLRRYTVNTTCILDGQRTGIVLSVSPLLPEEGSQIAGGSSTAPHGASSGPMNLSSVMGVVGGAGVGDVGRKFLYDGTQSEEGGSGLVVFVTHQVALVVRLLPAVEVCARLPRPEGIRDGAIPYTAWRRTKSKLGIPTGHVGSTAASNTSSCDSVRVSAEKDADGRPPENGHSKEDAVAEGVMAKGSSDGAESCPSLAIAWDRKVLIYQLPKSELKFVAQWDVDSPAVGVAWLEEQMMVVATSKDQLCLFTNEGIEIERATLEGEHGGIGAFIYHTHFMNLYGNPEKAYHNALAVRGAALYLLGPNRLWRARLLPWRDRIKALENAGDWMGAFHIAMEIYDGRSQGVTGLPKGVDAMREAIMPTLLALLSAYIDEAFAYLSLALGASSSQQTMKIAPDSVNRKGSMTQEQDTPVSELDVGVETSTQEMVMEAREQYARVGGVAIEFCVHICKTEVLFENVFSKFEAVGQPGTFLELLEPYILKDMLGGLAPEVMQALVEHYSSRGWLNRVEQCVLHMDIGSLDFNQVVRVCRDHGLYSALIYLFTKGLDDFKSPLEELLAVAQNTSHLPQAKAFGYKLLVYLKYCFTGLAFPPGNGTLPSSRVPKLRAELLGYLLDPMETRRDEVVSPEIDVHKLYPRLLYLLELDTQASLLVLGAAFPEDGPLGVGKRDWVYPLINIKPEQKDTNNHIDSQFKGDVFPTGESVIEGLKLAQETINAVVHILQTANNFGTTRESVQTQICSNKHWPSERDTGDILEFVAHFAAEKYAIVPAAIMSHILEHLTSQPMKDTADSDLPEKKKLAILKQREDLMVALLRAVPKSQWDVQQTLQIAQKTGYWQVTALLYAQMCDYPAALDSYLKDVSRPQHPFTFITHMLSSHGGLEGSNLSSFREAVLSRLPELIQLSTFSTLFVVLKHFSSENQRILRELAPHPKLLFNYLKAVMNVRSIGLDFSQSELEKDVASGQLSTQRGSLDIRQQVALSGREGGRNEDYSVLDSQVHLADLLQRSGLEFTDEMAETFVELLCCFEPKSVRVFLERYENYRLEHCLKLCQEYGITDAAAFLLERVGDVANALSLVLADVHICLQEMDQSLAKLVTTHSFTENFQSATGDEFLGLPKVAAVHAVLLAAVALCQRNTFRLEPQESESLWFRLLDRFVEPLHSLNLNKQMKTYSARKQHHMKSEVSHHTEQEQLTSRSILRWKVWGSDLASKLLKKVLVQFIGDIVNGMMGYIPLPVIMNKILEDHRGHEFGDFKATILNMLSAYGYERTILGTAKQLIEDDAFQNINALKRGCTHAFTPADAMCCVCDHRLDGPGFGGDKIGMRSSANTNRLKAKADDEKKSSHVDQLGIRIFPCGHATHLGCIELDSESETGRALDTVVCPICSFKRKPVDLSWHGKDPSLLKGGALEVRAGLTNHVKIEYSKHGNMYKTNDQVVGQSLLQLLNHLGKGTDLYNLGPSLKLNLAPVLPQYRRDSLPNGGSARIRGKMKSSVATSSKVENSLIPQHNSKSRTRY